MLALSSHNDQLLLYVRRKPTLQSRSELAKRKNIEKRRPSEQNSRMERHDQNLELGHSAATDFSQTPYLQNLKLHTFTSILDASQENVPRITRDIPI